MSNYSGGGTPVCPWDPIESVRARTAAVWVNELEYDLGDELREKSFIRLMEPCERSEAKAAFQAWREYLAEVEEEIDSPMSHVSVGSTNQEMVPAHERQELGLKRAPIVPPKEKGIDLEEEKLRLAFEAALTGSE